jgi:hypothetical protein
LRDGVLEPTDVGCYDGVASGVSRITLSRGGASVHCRARVTDGWNRRVWGGERGMEEGG